jgi:hypothetical protein
MSGFRLRASRSLVAKYKMAFVLIAGLLTVGIIGAVNKAADASTQPVDSGIRESNTFYAYVGAGENIDINFTKINGALSGGPADHSVTVSRPGAADVTCAFADTVAVGTVCSWSNLTASSAGVWRVSFVGNLLSGSTASRNGFTWSIDVQNGTTSIPGRVWSDTYSMSQISQFGFAPQASPTFWYMSDTGFIYRAQYRNYNGVDSVFSALKAGIVENGTCLSAYSSVERDNTSFEAEPNAIVSQCGGGYRVFFENPAADLPSTATRWDGTSTWVRNSVVNPTISNLNFSQTVPNTHEGTLTFDITNYSGNARIQVDVNNNGVFTDAVDRNIRFNAKTGSNSYVFNGRDQTGAVIPFTQKVTYRVLVDKIAEIHFINVDVEDRTGGVELLRLNGPATGRSTIYWNDTQLDANRCTTTSLTDARTGVDSTGGVHAWTNNATCEVNSTDPTKRSWGDMRSIEEWSYVPVDISASLEYPLAPAIDVVKSVGEVQQKTTQSFDVPYTIKVKNTGNTTNTNVQLTDDLTLTFAQGSPALKIVDPVSVVSGPCTANEAYNGDTDTRLLTGTDNHAVGDECSLTFTVNVTYADVASIPTDKQDNTAFASATSASEPNTGFTFNGTTPIPPAGVTVTDKSTDTSDLPVLPNGDTPTPTPVQFPRPAAAAEQQLSNTGISIWTSIVGSSALAVLGLGYMIRRYVS